MKPVGEVVRGWVSMEGESWLEAIEHGGEYARKEVAATAVTKGSTERLKQLNPGWPSGHLSNLLLRSSAWTA